MTEEVKRLQRSNTERWIGGVCGGIAEYFSIDPTVVRLLFVLFALAFGGGLLIYIVCWILIPAETSTVVDIEE